MFAVHMAVPFNHDTGQAIITYILLLTTPLLVCHLSSMLMPTYPQEAHTLARAFLQCPKIAKDSGAQVHFKTDSFPIGVDNHAS
jgi:hypothetical protein